MFTFTETDLLSMIAVILLPIFRITGFILAMPLFGNRLIPTRIKVILLSVLSISVYNASPPMAAFDPLSVLTWVTAVQQLVIGLGMGIIMRVVFQAFVFGGQIIAMQAGLGFSTLVDPQNGNQVPVFSQLYLMIITLLLLATNGHLVLIEILLRSFVWLPIGEPIIQINWVESVVLFGSVLFSGGVSLALPAIVSLLIVNLTFGVMTRAAPQFNIFSIGFPFTMVIGLVVVLFTIGLLNYHFNLLMNNAIQHLETRYFMKAP